MERCQIKLECAAPGYSFRYSAAVFSISVLARAIVCLGALACTACAALAINPVGAPAPSTFYTVRAEIALGLGEPRVAALQYATAAENVTDPGILKRATEVVAVALHPSLVERGAERWIVVGPGSLDAQGAAARAALDLHKIGQAAMHYRAILLASPAGAVAEFDMPESERTWNAIPLGARQVADSMVPFLRRSQRARHLQGLTALLAVDPAVAVQSLSAVLALDGSETPAARRELLRTLARAKMLSDDFNAPLAAARSVAERDATPENRLLYTRLLPAAQRDATATKEVEALVTSDDDAPLAVRLLGLLDFQVGRVTHAATGRFVELLRRQKFTEDAFYCLGLIADRHGDSENALRPDAQVQSGENAVATLLRAALLLNDHGACSAAEELLDALIEGYPQRAPEVLATRARMDAQAGDPPRRLD